MTPQQLKAMKLALSTLKEVQSETFRLLRNGQRLYAEEKVWNTIIEIKQALAEHAMSEVQRLGQEIEQEPVAIKRMKEWIEYLKRKSDHGQHMKIPSEMSAGACWELAIELEQFINTHPPQRTEQAPAVYSSFGLMGGDAFVSGDSLKRNIT